MRRSSISHPKHDFEGVVTRNPTNSFYALLGGKKIRLTGSSSLVALNRQGIPFFGSKRATRTVG